MENEITLDLLVKYFTENYKGELPKKEKIKDKFNLKILENFNSKNFSYFTDIFEYFVDRVGVRQYELKNKKHNISMLFSILHSIDDDFCTFDEDKQDCITRSVKKNIFYNLKKVKVSKSIVIDRMKSLDALDIDALIYSFYFGINIFVFDFVKNEINACYSEKYFNPYKANVLISKKNSLYQLITYKNNNSKVFKYNSSILKRILINKRFKVFSVSNNKQLEICRDYDRLLQQYKKVDLNNIIIGLDKKQIEQINDVVESSDSASEELSSLSSDSYCLENNDLTDDIEKIEKSATNTSIFSHDVDDLAQINDEIKELDNQIIDEEKEVNDMIEDNDDVEEKNEENNDVEENEENNDVEENEENNDVEENEENEYEKGPDPELIKILRSMSDSKMNKSTKKKLLEFLDCLDDNSENCEKLTKAKIIKKIRDTLANHK